MRTKDRYPLFGVKLHNRNETYWIVSDSIDRAIDRVRELYRRKRQTFPGVEKIENHGTIDHLPRVEKRYFNV
jgi:hypothetical protein